MAEQENDWQEMFGDTDAKGISLKVSYSAAANEYKVDISYAEERLTEKFNALYVPRFGMDVDDQRQALEIAEKLAVQLEQKLGL